MYPSPANGGRTRPARREQLANGLRNGARSVASLPARAASLLPRHLRRPLGPAAAAIRVSSTLADLAIVDPATALERLATSYEGLSDTEAVHRLEQLR